MLEEILMWVIIGAGFSFLIVQIVSEAVERHRRG